MNSEKSKTSRAGNQKQFQFLINSDILHNSSQFHKISNQTSSDTPASNHLKRSEEERSATLTHIGQRRVLSSDETKRKKEKEKRNHRPRFPSHLTSACIRAKAIDDPRRCARTIEEEEVPFVILPSERAKGRKKPRGRLALPSKGLKAQGRKLAGGGTRRGGGRILLSAKVEELRPIHLTARREFGVRSSDFTWSGRRGRVGV